VLAVLVIMLAFVTMYVLAGNTISQRKAQLASLKQQVAQLQAQTAQLNSYAEFRTLAQARAATVRQIAATRFDWHAALTDLSRVMPANASLQSLVATPSTSATGAAGASASSGAVRGAINAPAFELKGCTASQDDVAQLVSRLRLINGVSRVTLEDSIKQSSGQSGAAVSSAGSTPGSSGAGCKSGWPNFDMVVFFQPVSGAVGAAGAGTGPQSTGQQISNGIARSGQ
jgi:Tfp pilus assembly protein PilN